ncbi:MAG: hypothetical protein GX364_09400, partial [Firmicutes bacterium]|nr:hypothetical protein [Bacillota bacterium]
QSSRPVKYPAADITSAVPFRFLAFTGYGNHSLYVAYANISVRVETRARNHFIAVVRGA